MTDKNVGVALTFDYDAMSLWIGTFGAKSPSMTSRGEFGVIGVRRILSTLAHYKIPGTFYIPGHTAYAFPKSVQDIAAAGHEIGHHGWIHENPVTVPPARERWILEKGFQAQNPASSFARLAGIAERGMKLPRRFAADRAMRTNVVIVSTPSFAFLPRLVETEKPVGV